MEELKNLPKAPPCQKCNETKKLYKDGVCLGCYGLVVLEKTAWGNGEKISWIVCPQCNLEWSKLKDSGICFDCEKKKWEDFEKKKANENKMERIFGSLKAMNHYTFQRFKQTEGNEEAYKLCRDFDAKLHNLYMWGSAGLGKTHLAYSTAKMYALNGRDVVITTPLRMVDSFRIKSELEKEDRFQEFTQAEFLLIDDLGISKYTDFAIEILCEVMNRRALQMRNGLMVTSNLSLDALSDKLRDDRLPSRLMGLCQIVHLTGEDHRAYRT